MALKLDAGCFYGKALRNSDAAGLIFSESTYPPDSRLPKHSHLHPYFCFVMEGSYTETYGNKVRECKASTSVFHPAGEIHAEQFHQRGARVFSLELNRRWLKLVSEPTVALIDPSDFNVGPVSWILTRIYRESRLMDHASPLIIEGLVLEILGEASRTRLSRSERRSPRWLEQVKELLHAHCFESLSLSAIAEAVSMHPSHITRAFRQFYGCTTGEYVRQLRVEMAARQLSTSDIPLAAIAASAGFSDQSHFSKTFKCLTGLTPAQYRATFRPC